MKKAILLLILSFTVSGSLFSQNAPTLAPLNPAFVRFMDKLNNGKAPSTVSDEYGTGAMPPPGIVNFDTYLNNNRLKAVTFDPVYDLRTHGLLTPVKGQTGNACWAFATMASVESRWLKSGLGTWDLSENNLKYCHGFDPSRSTYGNHWMSTAYFARRSGPLVEADDPNGPGSLCPADKTPVGYITDARYLPNDMNTIKQAILDQGAIFTLMYFSSTYYNAANFTYYRGDSADVNHAVDLVGWDDNKVTEGGTGAWICKNSYGTGWGESGYFYVSYNDKSILDYNAYWPVRYTYEPSVKVYGYDDLGNYNSIYYAAPDGSMLVKYVASGKQLLSKAGTYAMAAGTTLEIDVFDNFDQQTKILSGLLSHNTGLLCEMPGYYTFDLTAPVTIEQGNDFYVRVRYHTPNFAYPVPVEMAIVGYAAPVIESNVAWISADGGVADPWFMIGNSTADFKWDPCVKVYAEPYPALLTWNGTISDDWNTYANWTPAFVPDASVDVLIPNVTRKPVVNQSMATPAVCKNMTVNTGSSLIINTGKALTVTGDLTNHAGSSGLIAESGASLITMGDINGTATVKRNITGGIWHFISPPVSDAVSGIFTGKYMQEHTESTNAYDYITLVNIALNPLQGYALWNSYDFAATYTGALNTGPISAALTRTTADPVNNGWNLVGNPYPSSIDWDAASGWTKINVNRTIYFEKAGDWATYISGEGATPGVGANGGNQFIASGQGFFVSVADVGNGILAMNNNVRVHNAGTFFKNAAVSSLVRLQVSGFSNSDEAVVRFIDEATVEYDNRYDAVKLFGDKYDSAQIYTVGGNSLTINSLPPGTTGVPLGIHAYKTGIYTIAATETGNLKDIILEDLKTGILTQLTTKPYSFTFETGEKELRFKLYFDPVLYTGTDETESQVATVYSYEHTIHVNLNDWVKGDILIYNIEGQQVAAKTPAQGINSFALPGTGIYIVKVITGEQTMVRKVFIH